MNEEQNAAIEKVLFETVSSKAARELAYLEKNDLTEVYHLLQEQMEYNGLMEEQPTAKAVLQDLYALTQAENIITDDEPITLADYQDLIYQNVDLLAAILGIELEV